MSEPDDFLSDILPRQIKAEEAIHKGDPEPRLEMWSTGDPVTLFGALGVCKSGTDEVTQTSRWVASLFSNNTSYSFDLVTAGVSGDLAYTAGYERHTTSLDGGPVEPHTLARNARLPPRGRRVEDRPPPWRHPARRSEHARGSDMEPIS
jgi:hypothetical protein